MSVFLGFSDKDFYNTIMICLKSCSLRDAMRRLYTGVFALGLLLLLTVSVTYVQAAETPKDLVSCEFTVNVVNGAFFSIQVNADVQSFTLEASGKTYTASDIQGFSTSNPEKMGMIKYAIKTALSSQIRESFPGSDIQTDQELPSYASSGFLDSYNITLSPTFFSLNESVNAVDVVNGLMDCGATVNYTISLKASAGWNNTYVFVLSDDIGYRRTTGVVKQDRITWKVLNWDGNTPLKDAEVTFIDNSPSIGTPINETTKVTFELDCTEPKDPQLTVMLHAENIDISSLDLLPVCFSNVNILPADGIRLLVENNLTSWNALYFNTFKPASEEIIPTIESSLFNQSVDVVFSWDNSTTDQCDTPYDLTSMDSVPPIRGLFVDEYIDLRIFDVSSRAVFGCINAGGTATVTSSDINFGDTLPSLTYPYNCSLIPPEHVLLDGKSSFLWDDLNPLDGNLSSDNAPMYSKEDISTDILIDIESTDMNLLSYFTGRTELTIGVYLSETQMRNVTLMPDQLDIPHRLTLDYMNADAFRLFVDESVFPQERVSLFLAQQTRLFENRSKQMFPLLQGKALVDKEIYEGSLLWDENISSMDGDEPVLVSSTFHSSYPLAFSFSVIPPGFEVKSQNITFTGIPNQKVTYSMVFPPGTTIDINDTLGRAMLCETIEGKKCLLITFNDSEGDLVDIVTVYMQPSGLFILGLFVPCIISIIITIILFIVVFVIRKKRKRFKGPEGPANSQYQDEDYYVPPPPRSSKKK